MNKKYLISYQVKNAHTDMIEDAQVEVPTREEADQKAEDLQSEGYENIIIEEIRI